MKRILNISILLLVLALSVSCAKEEHRIQNLNGIILFSGTCLEGDTKTTINGNTFSWVIDDAVGVFFSLPHGNINNAQFIAKELTAAGKNATFVSSSSLDLSEGSESKTIAGYYPYSSTQTSDLSFAVDPIQQQTDVTASHLGQWDFMATTASAWTDALPTLAFKHLMAKISFTFSNEYSTSLTISKITMKPKAGKFHSKGTLKLLEGSGTPALLPVVGNDVSEVGVEVSGDWTTVAAGSTLSASMMLMPVNLSSDEVDITVFTDKGSFIYTKTGLNFLQGNNYNLSLSIRERVLTVTPEAIDLGEAGTTSSITLKSVNGQTSVALSSDAAWLSLSESSVVVPEFDNANQATIKTVTVTADRENLTKGTYTAKISVTSDAGNYEIPVTVIVPGSEVILTCHDDLRFTLVSCTMSGTSAKISMKVKNTGNSTISLMFRCTYNSEESYAYDERGNQYAISSVAIAGSSGTYTITKDIPSGIETSAEIVVSNIVDLAAMLKYVTVATNFSNLILKNVGIDGRIASALPDPTTTGTVLSCSDGLEFTLLGCKIGASGTTISFRIKNISNSTISLLLRCTDNSDDSYAYDERGNQYSIDRVEIGMYAGNYTTSTKIPPSTYCNGSFRVAGLSDLSAILKYINVGNNLSSYLAMKDVAIEGRTGSALPNPTTTGTVLSCSDGLEFTLLGCKIGASGTTVSFRIKNISNSTISLMFRCTYNSDDSYAYDELGNQYSIDRVEIGRYSGDYTASTKIPPATYCNGSIRVAGLSDLSAILKYINIGNNLSSYLVMKDVAIEGRTGSALPDPTTTGTVLSCSDGLEFTLLGCKIGASGTTVSFRIKNISNSTISLMFRCTYNSDDSYAYDELGNQYSIDRVEIGRYSGDYTTSTKIPPATYCNGSFRMANIVNEAKFVKIAQIATNWSNLKFSDVAIEGR